MTMKSTSSDGPERSSSLGSRLTFWWFTALAIKGHNTRLHMSDVWNLEKSHQSCHIVPKFLLHWNDELHTTATYVANQNDKDNPSQHLNPEHKNAKLKPEERIQSRLWKPIMKSFAPYYLIGSVLTLLNIIMTFTQPLILKHLIYYFESDDVPLWHGYLYAVSICLVMIFESVLRQHYLHINYITGMKIRASLSALIFKKSLRLSNSVMQLASIGDIVNYLSMDTQNVCDATNYFNEFWATPLNIIVGLFMLWSLLGPAILGGVLVIVLLIPLNGLIAKQIQKLQIMQMEHKDSRIKIMNEVITAIKLIKLYAWNLSFQLKVSFIRNLELNVFKKSAYCNAASSFAWACAPVIAPLITFAVYVLSSNEHILDAEKAFVSLCLFNIIKIPISMFPMIVNNFVVMKVSLNRLQAFLALAELDPNNTTRDIDDFSVAVSIEHGNFSWETNSSDGEMCSILNDINIRIDKGSLVAIIGQVGCGKSSLLSAMLGEMTKVSGIVRISGSIAYVPQQAWLLNDTVKNNILFYRMENMEFFNDTIIACALNPDLDMLPDKELTDIRERGVNLSGGQKQRISIARALYMDTDIYLFDDPLSAVDSQVGNHIFNAIISPNGRLSEKTRIIVTSQHSILPKVDKIIVLDKGVITNVGTYEELSQQGLLLTPSNPMQKIYENGGLDIDDIMHISEKNNMAISTSRTSSLSCSDMYKNASQSTLYKLFDPATPYSSMTSLQSYKEMDMHESSYLEQEIVPENEKSEEEKVMTDRAKFSLLVLYLKPFGIGLIFMTILFFTLNKVTSVYSSIWLAEWSSDRAENGTINIQLRNKRLGVFAALGIVQGLLEFMSAFSMAYCGIQASRCLHDKLVTSLLAAPMTFFDVTPLGKVMTRLSDDISSIDFAMPFSVRSVINSILLALTTFGMVTFIFPWIILSLPILGVMYFFLQRFYIPTSRQLKRLDAVTRGPIYSHVGEIVNGASTIRTDKKVYVFLKEAARRVDENHRFYYASQVSKLWLSIYLEFIGNCVVLLAAILAVYGKDHLSPGIVGLSITYALGITQALNSMVQAISDLETNIVSVERIKEFVEVPPERSCILYPQAVVDDTWPRQENIEIKKYSTQYRKDSGDVLHNITAFIKGGEKVGIVGRTGAGKTSLTMAIFRILEGTGGSIEIGGIDIARIPLQELRSKLTIIPQDPVLFSGTIRSNIDPLGVSTDEELWNALNHSHLKSYISSLPGNLDYMCSNGGENVSIGQKQLLCLARALLRKPKILILDEATAAIDIETDDLLQSTIRTVLKESTVLTVAHRLNTIMDHDRILVLDNGVIVEYDEPRTLLLRKGAFYLMAKDAGLVE